MRRLFFGFVIMAMAAAGITSLRAQTFARTPDNATAVQLQALSKKIEEQNTKIDLLSQQILKLEQQLNNTRPGVIIGEATPSAPAPAPVAEASSHAAAAGGNTHTVARGETLTSIAKMHNVSLGDLQKANHIENDRKLQIGQTIIIPAASPSPQGE